MKSKTSKIIIIAVVIGIVFVVILSLIAILVIKGESNEVVEKSTFNMKFKLYEANKIEGTKVNALLDTIRKNNTENPDRQVKAMANVSNWDYDNNKADNNSNYKVTCEEDSETGYVNVVKIEDAN